MDVYVFEGFKNDFKTTKKRATKLIEGIKYEFKNR